MPYDPERDGPYGKWLQKKGVQTNRGATTPRVREGRDDNGRRRKVMTEPTDSGALATTTQRTDERGGHHQDVHIHAPCVTSKTVIPQVGG